MLVTKLDETKHPGASEEDPDTLQSYFINENVHLMYDARVLKLQVEV